jgi:hypothetical protein
MTVRLALLLLAASPSGSGPGTAAKAPTLADRARDADRVVLAKVIDTSVQVPEGDVMRMVTLTHLAVEQNYRGQGPKTVELVQLGGKYGPWERHVHGDATFAQGERAVLFLRCKNPDRKERCTLIGLGEGKLPLIDAKTVQIAGLLGPQQKPLSQLVAELGTAVTQPQASSQVSR